MYQRNLLKKTAAVLLAVLTVGMQGRHAVPALAADVTAPQGFQTVAQTDALLLAVSEQDTNIAVTNKKDGSVWYAFPPDYGQDKKSTGLSKSRLGSLLVISYANRDTNITYADSNAGSVAKGGAVVSRLANGVRMGFTFPEADIFVPVELTLAGDALQARIITAEITQSNPAFVLTTLTLLPNFGAAGLADTGYSFVPDGCGALIAHNNQNSNVDYSQYVYGRENAIVEKTSDAVAETARLPVFGAKKNSSAYLAVLRQGAPRAKLNAHIAGLSNSYNTVECEWIYQDCAVVDIGKKTYETTKVTMFEPEHTAAPLFEAAYYFLEGKDADYVGMAKRYRQYLTEECGVQQKTAPGTAPFYLELLGGVKHLQTVWGIPMQRVSPLTTLEDIGTITGDLRDNGIQDMVVNYTYWTKGGSNNVFPTELAPDGALGSKKQLNTLLQQLSDQQIETYLDANLTDMFTGAGSHVKAAKSVQKNDAMQYLYSLGTYQIMDKAPVYTLLSPLYLPQAAERIAKKAGSVLATGYSANTLVQKIYSDFGKKHLDRAASQEIWEDALALVDGMTGHSLGKAANAYAFGYTEHLTDVPIATSQYIIETNEVPFYQIALHGLIPLSTTAVNAAATPRRTLLKAVETGSSLKYTFANRNVDDLTGTVLRDYSYIEYSQWRDYAIASYHETQDYLRSVADQPIVAHSSQNGLTKTRFANGVIAYVNYTNADQATDGLTVPAQNFVIKNGGM